MFLSYHNELGEKIMEHGALETIHHEMLALLKDKMIPFWLDRCVDDLYGGYLTDFDENGNYGGNGTKYLVTQSRMVWGFSNLLEFARLEDQQRMKKAAAQGAAFLIDKFWDLKFGGFFWQLNRDGTVADDSKLVYGEGFAIYALSEYYLRYDDHKALEYAKKGFDNLQIYCADNLRGGYYENVERDWTISPFGAQCGNRKSLDIHMHLLETFTTLSKATGDEIHIRRLSDVLRIIVTHMIDTKIGYGYNQFDLDFKRIPAINIPRTWNAERETNEIIETPKDTTSYGHNIEFTWLASQALDVLKIDRTWYDELFCKILDHTLVHGFDEEKGGVYRDGVADGPVLVTDKEWWQNFESLCGFLNGYELYKDERYLYAFFRTWDFIKKYFINFELGESRQLLTKDGKPIVSTLGNSWKGIYHTGRAIAETIRRIRRIGI